MFARGFVIGIYLENYGVDHAVLIYAEREAVLSKLKSFIGTHGAVEKGIDFLISSCMFDGIGNLLVSFGVSDKQYRWNRKNSYRAK